MPTPLEGFVRSERLGGKPGDLADVGHSTKLTYTNDDPRAAQSDTITVTGSTNNKTYTVTIDGIDISFTADATATVAEIADGLADAINAEPLVNGRLTATSDNVDTVTLVARVGGTGYTLEESDAELTTASVTANATADPVPFGRAVVANGLSVGGNKLAKLADAAGLTAQSLDITYNAGTVQVLFRLDGDPDVLEAEGGSAAALATAIDGLTGLAASEAGGVITVTPEVAGQGFQLESLDGDADVTAQSEGDNINKLIVGVTMRSHSQEVNLDELDAEYEGGEAMTVLTSGRIFVATETDVATPSDGVFVRLAADGTLDQLGGFSAAPGTGLVRWTGAHWIRQVESGLAVLEVNR